MDEIWQRHKTFILQMIVVSLVFLIALAVMSNSFSGPTDDAKQISATNKSMKETVEKNEAPSKKSIDEQIQKALQAEEQIRSMASKVASLKLGEDYVKENLQWIAGTIGKDAKAVDAWFALYKDLPQTGLSKVREEVRSALVGRAAQQGKQIDENLGLTQGYEDGEVPQAIHGLAIIADIVSRALIMEKLDAVGDMRISSTNALPIDEPWISGFKVHVSLTGDPEAVNTMIRSFNETDNRMQRMTVIEQVESISRPRREDDSVKAQMSLYGLQYKGVSSAQGAGR